MGVAVSSEAFHRERQLRLNQELWNSERKAEKNRMFYKNFRKGNEKKTIEEIDRQHLNFLRKIEFVNHERKKSYESELLSNKKILGDNRYFKEFIKNIQTPKNKT